DLVEARLDGGEALLHAPLHQREVGLLPPLLLPALEHGGHEIELGENVAEARRDHLLALEPAAERQQRQIDRKRKSGRIAPERGVEAAHGSGVGRGREQPTGPGPAPRAKSVGEAVTHMAPERAVELLEAAFAVGIFERAHLLEQIRMAADRALTEL